MPPQMNAGQKQQVVANLSAIHRTLDVLITIGDYESAGSIAKALGNIWFSHGFIDDGMHYLSAILNSPGSNGLSENLLVALYGNYGDLAQGKGHYELAEV